MKWHYCKRGDSSRRGVVDDQGLADLAARGDLGRKDLVFSDSTGSRWVSALTVQGLFADVPDEHEAVEPSSCSAPEPSAASPTAPPRVPAARKSRGKSLVAAAVMLVVVVVALVLQGSPAFRALFKKSADATPGRVEPAREPGADEDISSVETDMTPTNGPAAIARSNRVAELVRVIEWHLHRRTPDSATASILELEEYEPERAKVYNARAGRVRAEETSRAGLLKALRSGALDAQGAADLLELYGSYGNSTGLVASVAAMLDDRDLLSPGLALSVAHVAGCAGDDELLVRSLNEFTTRVTEWQSTADCVAASRLYVSRQDRAGCVKLLNRCIEDRPDSADLRLELAAVQAGGDDLKLALKTLKEAVGLGGAETAAAALGDTRFRPLKDDRSFKRIVGAD